jgi:hypothetical protein
VLLVVVDIGRAVLTGDVETRFSDRGCRGVIGAELERRRAFRVAVLTKPPSSCFLGGTGFAASPSALRVAFTT